MPEQEIVIPGLPCRSLDDVLPFYEALGFETTYRQERPNPFAAVERGGIRLHFFGLPTFNPGDSMGTVVVLVSDTEALHAAFASGLRAAFGKVPVAGIPRMTRPRRRLGAGAGFSVVDPGGNWLRISQLGGEAAEGDLDSIGGELAQVVAAAARQADARGDERAAIRLLENGLARHAEAPGAQQLPALVYLAELRIRVGEREAALPLLANVARLELSAGERAALSAELATAEELRAELPE